MKSSDQIEAEGGPAFSYATGDPQAGGDIWKGMTLRDWFAGQAVTGACANANIKDHADLFAAAAYIMADAMLARRTR